MRDGFTTDELKEYLGLKCRGSATDAVNPGLRKSARLYVIDPVKWFQMFLPFIVEAHGDLLRERQLADELSASPSNKRMAHASFR